MSTPNHRPQVIKDYLQGQIQVADMLCCTSAVQTIIISKNGHGQLFITRKPAGPSYPIHEDELISLLMRMRQSGVFRLEALKWAIGGWYHVPVYPIS